MLSRLVCAAFFAWVAAGSIWVTAELSGSSEASEVLRLPYRPLRVSWCASAVLVPPLFLGAVFDRRARHE